jgi:hypothetical protein
MGQYNFTTEGIRRFADLLKMQMNDAFPKITVLELINRLAAIGYDTNASRIDRLKAGLATEPPAGLIWAIAKLNFLTKPSGELYSHEELLQIMTGVNPAASVAAGVEYDPDVPNAEAVKIIRTKMREMGKNSDAFARFCEVEPIRMREILGGEIPTWVEFINLGRVLFADQNPAPLIELYPISVEKPTASGRKSRRSDRTD